MELVDFIARESHPDRAESVLLDILDAGDRLAEMPDIGHLRTDLTDESLRFWLVHNHFIVYRPDQRPLEIVRVLHGARNPEALRSAIRPPSDT